MERYVSISVECDNIDSTLFFTADSSKIEDAGKLLEGAADKLKPQLKKGASRLREAVEEII